MLIISSFLTNLLQKIAKGKGSKRSAYIHELILCKILVEFILWTAKLTGIGSKHKPTNNN